MSNAMQIRAGGCLRGAAVETATVASCQRSFGNVFTAAWLNVERAMLEWAEILPCLTGKQAVHGIDTATGFDPIRSERHA